MAMIHHLSPFNFKDQPKETAAFGGVFAVVFIICLVIPLPSAIALCL